MSDIQKCDIRCKIHCHKRLVRLLRKDLLYKSTAAEFGENIRKTFSHLIYREKHLETHPKHKGFCSTCTRCIIGCEITDTEYEIVESSSSESESNSSESKVNLA